MSVTERKERFTSTNGKTEVAYYVFEDQNVAPKAIIQLIHGMTEHIGRYEAFARYLCENGVVFCGCDLLGHGDSISEENPQGYFSDEKMPDVLLDDQVKLIEIMRKKYRSLPYIIYGHSLGSFLARRFCALHGELLDGAIFEGTAGSDLPVGLGKASASLIGAFHGKRRQSKTLQKATFMGYLKHCGKDEGKMAWLTHDKASLENYENDPKCGFAFSAKAYHQMFSLISYISSPEWYETVPKCLPIFMISGDDDPVGSYGKGPKEVYELLKDAELSDVSLKLYPGMRHEPHSEIGREEVYADVLAFACRVADGVADARSYANTIIQ